MLPEMTALALYKVLNEKGNFIDRDCPHLISTNEKFIVKQDYENIIEPSEITSQNSAVPPRTDIPSNIAEPSVRTNSGHIVRKPKKWCLGKCLMVS